MTPRQGNTILFRSSQQLPRLRSEPLRAFQADRGALRWVRDANLDCVFVKTHFLH